MGSREACQVRKEAALSGAPMCREEAWLELNTWNRLGRCVDSRRTDF